MPHEPAEVEELYKQGLVSTASVPRVVLLMYERLLLLLKQALACEQDLPGLHCHLAQASQILSHLLGMFLQSEDPAYRTLYLEHEQLAQELTEIFRRPGQGEALARCYHRLEAYHAAWQQQLHLRPPLPDPASEGLNVKRRQADQAPV